VPPRLFAFQTHPLEISQAEFTRVTINKFRKKSDRGILDDLDAIGWSPESHLNAYKLCGNMLLEQHTKIEQNVDIFHLARVIEGLPNLRAVNITATIDIY
jgi:hypothetical protein